MPKERRPPHGWRRLHAGPLVVFSGVVLLAAIAYLLPGHAAAQTLPPASGDWTINDATSLSSQTVDITGNVIVNNGGSLTLTGANLRINSSYSGEFKIVVQTGGALTVAGGLITAVSPANSYKFEIYGSATIDGATVSYMWGSNTTAKFGIQIYSGNVAITNSTVMLGQRGNILVSSGSPLLRNNIVQNAVYMDVGFTSAWACQYFVTFEAVGIYVTNGSSPRLEGNTIQRNGPGSSFVDPWRAYYDAHFDNASCGTYWQIEEDVRGYGLWVDGASAEASKNNVTENSYNPLSFSYFTYNGTSVYVSRYPFDSSGNGGIVSPAAGVLLRSAGGNYTDFFVDRNHYFGIVGEGGRAFVQRARVSTQNDQGSSYYGSAFGAGGNLDVHNSTTRDNLYTVVLYGSGKGVFENLTIENRANANVPPVWTDPYGGGTLDFYNVSFNSSWSPAIQLNSYSWLANSLNVNLYNCTIEASQIAGPADALVQASWQFQVQVTWSNLVPVPGAFVIVTNSSKSVIVADAADDQGATTLTWLVGIVWQLSSSGGTSTTVNSPLDVKVYTNGTISPVYSFVFNRTTLLQVAIPDPVPPQLNVFFPSTGQGFNSSRVVANGNAYDIGSGMDFVEASADGGGSWTRSVDPLPGWSIPLDLSDGTHDITIRAVDRAGTSTEVSITGIHVDTVAPDIVILQPALPTSGELVAYTTFTAVILRGTVEDGALLTVNGDPLAVQGGTFSKQLILAEGANFFHLIAVDNVGNRDQVDFVLFSDTIPPSIFVSSPTDNFATNRSIIAVAGVTETDVSLTLNNQPMTTSGGVFSQSYSLSEGVNTLRITATDRAGNNNTVVRTVTFDTVAPQITLLSPTANLLTRNPNLVVTGQVEASIATVFIGGAPVPTSAGLFAKLVRLDEGRNVIVVQAWDLAGNPATASAFVTLDTVPPELSIDSPADGTLVNTSGIHVTGSFANATTVTLNGIAVTDLGGAFDEQLGLAEGDNLVVATAVDAAGNLIEIRLHVVRDTLPPDLSTSLPSTPLETNASLITVTGRAVGASAVWVKGQLVALDAGGNFSVAVPLILGENQIDIRAQDAAGNTQTVLGVVVRVSPPLAPQGLFGLGDLQYALLPLFLVVGAAATFAALRLRAARREN